MRLTNNSPNYARPSWSAERNSIAFQSDRDGNWEIYVMNADGSNQTRLTNNPAVDEWPFWSPDGTKIAFDSDRDCKNEIDEIYVMNTDGSNQTRLTTGCVKTGIGSWR